MSNVIEQAATEFKLERSEWSLVRFGDVAVKQNKSVDRENTHLKNYVKGEHMSSADLHLREWGELADEYLGPAFIRYFEEGDILYGSRRTYLRKVTIAPFEGITSNTTFVIKANEDLIEKRLLPFLLLSERFSEHSISNSKGSVNPYVNWKDIASYEFLLPPKAQQAEIAELLWAMDEVIQKDTLLLANAETHLNSKIEKQLHGEKLAGKTINEVLAELPTKTDVVLLGQCGEIVKGKGIPKGDVVQSGLPCVRYGELYTQHHKIIRTCKSFIGEATVSSAFRLMKNDVLFAGSGETITEIGKSAAFTSDEETYAGSDILIFRPYRMDGAYLGYLMNSQLVRQQLNKYGSGATVMHIYKSDLEKIKIPQVDYDEQVQIGREFEVLADNLNSLKQKIKSSKSLHKSLINQVF